MSASRGPPRCSKAVHLGDGSRAQRLATRVLNAPEHLRLAPGIKDSEGYEPRCCFQGSLCFKAGSCLPRRDGPSRQQFFAVGRHRADAHHNVTRPGRQTGAAHRKGPWGASEPIVECTGAHGWRHEAATPQSSMALERWLWPVTEDQHWQSAECCLSLAYAKAEPGEALSLQTPATQVAFTWIQAAGSAPLADRTQLAAYTIDSDGYVGKRLKAWATVEPGTVPRLES